jgi:cytochrome P450
MTTQTSTPSTVCPSASDYLPYTDTQFRIDPYPFYARAQAEAPVMREPDGTFVLTKYEDLMHYGRLPSLVVVPEWEKAGSWSTLTNMVTGSDEPEHTRLKRQTSKWLTPKRVQDWVTFTASITDELLDGIDDGGLVDGSDLAVEATHRTICRVLQVPEDEIAEARWAMQQAMPVLSAVPDPADFGKCEAAHAYMRRRTAALIEHSRANPGTGLLDYLLGAQDRGDMTDIEVSTTLLFFFFVGHMDASYLISSGLHLFTRRPDIFDTFRTQPHVRESIMSELVRMDAPEPFITRETTEDMVVRGIHIPAGSVLRLVLGAANRDPDVFDNPQEFNFRRPPEQSRNLTFSLGSHTCQGRLLAEAEIRVVWERIAQRYSRIELAGEPDIRNTDASRHYSTLPLRFCS